MGSAPYQGGTLLYYLPPQQPTLPTRTQCPISGGYFTLLFTTPTAHPAHSDTVPHIRGVLYFIIYHPNSPPCPLGHSAPYQGGTLLYYLPPQQPTLPTRTQCPVSGGKFTLLFTTPTAHPAHSDTVPRIRGEIYFIIHHSNSPPCPLGHSAPYQGGNLLHYSPLQQPTMPTRTQCPV